MAEAAAPSVATVANGPGTPTRRGAADLLAAVPAPALAIGLAAAALAAHALLWGAQAPWGRAPEAGVVGVAAGLAWAGWAWRVLQRAAAVPGLASYDRVFVDDGPYAYGRHPMYLGLALAMLGAGLAAGAPSMLAAAATFVAVVGRVHVPREEAALRRAHGAWYSDYAGDVPRWF